MKLPEGKDFGHCHIPAIDPGHTHSNTHTDTHFFSEQLIPFWDSSKQYQVFPDV